MQCTARTQKVNFSLSSQASQLALSADQQSCGPAFAVLNPIPFKALPEHWTGQEHGTSLQPLLLPQRPQHRAVTACSNSKTPLPAELLDQRKFKLFLELF